MRSARIAHLSLWHSADPRDVADYVELVVDIEDARVVTTTEANRAMARATRRRLGKRFIVARVGEHMIAWERSTFGGRRRRQAWLVLLTTLRFFNPRGRLLRFDPARFRLRWHGRPILVWVAHIPSSIQNGGEWSGARLRVAATKNGIHRWGRKRRHWRRRHPGGVQILCMDSNLDQHRKVWRDYLTDQLGCPSVWAKDRPAAGTHAGRRLIDTAHVDGAGVVAEDARLCRVDPPPGVDHRGFVFTIVEKHGVA